MQSKALLSKRRLLALVACTLAAFAGVLAGAVTGASADHKKPFIPFILPQQPPVPSKPPADASPQPTANEPGHTNAKDDSSPPPTANEPGHSNSTPANEPGHTNPTTDDEDEGEDKDDDDKDQASTQATTPELFSSQDDPGCDESASLSATEKEWCKRSGSVAYPYPLSHYGLDVSAQGGVLDLGPLVLGELQFLISLLWLLLTYGLKLLLLLLGWAFSPKLNLMSDDHIGGIKAGVKHIQQDFFGTAWMLAGLTAFGIWAIWNGLIRMRVTETLGGMAATLALMVAALCAIANPGATVGRLATVSNQAALGVLSLTSSGNVRNRDSSLKGIEQGLFNMFVEQPWCKANFGDLKWCEAAPPGRGKGAKPPPGLASVPATNADLWLSYPANSDEREVLHNLTAGKGVRKGFWSWLTSTHKPTLDHKQWGENQLPNQGKMADLEKGLQPFVTKNPTMVSLQEANASALSARFGVFLVIAIGWLGAMCMLLYLGLRVATAAVMVVLMLFVAPLVMLLAGFGEAGRALNVTYWKRIFAYSLQQLIYATGLGILILVATIVQAVGIGWLSGYGLVAVLMWGAFKHREELFGQLGLNLADVMPRRGTGLSGGLRTMMQAYYGLRLAGATRDGLARMTGVRNWQANRLSRGMALEEGARQAHDSAGRAHAATAVEARKTAAYNAARPVHDRANRIRARLDAIKTELAPHKTRLKDLEKRQGDLLGQQRGLDSSWARHQADYERAQISADASQAKLNHYGDQIVDSWIDGDQRGMGMWKQKYELERENFITSQTEAHNAMNHLHENAGRQMALDRDIAEGQHDILTTRGNIDRLEREHEHLSTDLVTNADDYVNAGRTVRDGDTNGLEATERETSDFLQQARHDPATRGTPLGGILRHDSKGLPGDTQELTRRAHLEAQNRRRWRKVTRRGG